MQGPLEVRKTYVIAEAGVNHNGSLELAGKLVEAAKQAGADAVKFQTFRSEDLVTEGAPRAEYQVRNTGDSSSQFAMLKALELDVAAHRTLIEKAHAEGINFLSTPFDILSLRILVDDLQLPLLKIASGEITNGPLLLEAARTGRPVILSTGMSSLADVEEALGVLAFGYAAAADERPSRKAFARAYFSPEGRRQLAGKVTLLHCTTEYPAPFSEVNLRAMDAMAAAFALPVGFSDHTPGIAIPIAAVARGARVIEKHLTLDCHMPGPDHKASLEPAEFAAMVKGIRETEAALGDGAKVPTPSEIGNRLIARKKLIAARPIAAGEAFTSHNLAVKRPGDGLSPMAYWDMLDAIASRDFAKDDGIE